MAEETDIRDFIHERFTHLDQKLDGTISEIGEVKTPLTSLEARMTSLEASVVHVHERMDGLQRQLDNIGGRLDRLERRLELADAPA